MLPLATGTSSNSSNSSSTLAPRACLITARVNFRECAGACSHKTGRLASMTASVTGLGVRAYIVAWVVQCKLQGWHMQALVMTNQGRDQQKAHSYLLHECSVRGSGVLGLFMLSQPPLRSGAPRSAVQGTNLGVKVLRDGADVGREQIAEAQEGHT